MKIPGFTAEASLYKTSGHYQMVEIGDHTDRAIYPAQLDFSSWNYLVRCMRFGYQCDYIWDPTHGLKVTNCGYRFYFVC